MTTVEEPPPEYWDDDPEEPRDLTPDEIDRILARIDPTPVPTEELCADPELDAFLSEPEPDYEWLVPGVIERGDRAILTGGEGAGKSTLLRQIGVQCAAGIHPFTLRRIDPINVLVVDLENSRRQTKRQLRPLRVAAGEAYPNKLLNIIIHGGGVDLATAAGEIWLDERVRANKPDLLIIGPIYKMVGGDLTEEGPARAAAASLDLLRERYGIAMLIEAHSPHATNGGTRPTRPYGASLWMRWPEFGLHITDTGQLKHWRGDRDERDWPTALRRGGNWPWSPVTGTVEQTFATIVALVEDTGQPLSYGEIAALMGCSKSWVSKTIKENRSAWDELKRRVGGLWP